MKYVLSLALLTVLAGCAGGPQNPEIGYCASYGLKPGDAEYQNCHAFYYEQEAAFGRDRAICEAEADGLYPRNLYSRPSSYPVRRYGMRGGFPRTEMVHVGADYQHNAQLDNLRMRIIEPCMQVRGWNSGSVWTAGRHPVNMYPLNKPKPLLNDKLPWQK
ncbi:MAG: hypothetical protein DI582_09915 [Azospirillum brasilense]|nr:MAG: hypothetical protein DI582_09915 [Azospirillum brasilense]